MEMSWEEFIALSEQEELGRPPVEEHLKEAVLALKATQLETPKGARGHTRDSVPNDGAITQLQDIMALAMVRRTLAAVELQNVIGKAVNGAIPLPRRMLLTGLCTTVEPAEASSSKSSGLSHTP